MDDELARALAVLCGCIMSASAGEKDDTKALARADVYLDFIKPFSLKVARDGQITFTQDDGGGE